ncbi:MAG: DUF1109 domain-containing protein [Ramlibacter sp.]|nr:DUF1109 domain-containing protein [Ramlibacter sp.]
MKTPELIAGLAADASPVRPAQADRRFHLKLGIGALLTFAAVLVLMGPRDDLDTASSLPMFWLKLLFPASLALAALVGLNRLGHPGIRLGRVPAAVLLAVGLLWSVAAFVLLDAPAGERLPLVLGQSWLACSAGIALVSVPAFALAFLAIRELAPTRLSLAGAAAGLFAGAAGACAYALHCAEMQAPFLAVWYVLGMLVPMAAGAILGRRLLRW